MNKLSYGLLAFIARQPLSGYDVMLHIQPFWQAKHSQIYPLLSQMEENGLLTSEWIKQYDKPDKKLYAITEQGLNKLTSWLDAPLADPVTRDELSLKLYCMWLTDQERAIEMIQSRLDFYENRLELLHKTLRSIPESKRDFGNREFFDYMLVQKGIYQADAGKQWCSMMLEALQSGSTTQDSTFTIESMENKIKI